MDKTLTVRINLDNDSISIFDTLGGTGYFFPSQKDYHQLVQKIVDCSYNPTSDVFNLPGQTIRNLEERGLLK